MWAGLGALCLITCMPGLGARPLWDSDEPRRALVAAEMLSTGDWLIPRVGGEPFAFYPPLAYWLMAIVGLVTGITPFAARLPSVIGACGAVLTTFWIGRHLMDGRRGAAAAAILALTPGFVHMGRIVGPDTLLLFFQLLLLAFFLEWMRRADTGEPQAWVIVGMIAAGAGGILSKGPVGIGFPLLVGLAYLAAIRRLALLKRYPWLRVTAGMLALALPWYVLVGMRAGADFLYVNVIRENVLAPAGQDKHVYGFGFYFAQLPLRIVPWLLLVPPILVDRSWRRPETRMAWCWFAALFVVLTLSASKRVTYMVFLYPPLAMLFGDAAVRLARGETTAGPVRALRGSLGAFGLALLGVPPIVAQIRGSDPLWSHYGWLVAVASGAGGLAILLPTLLDRTSHGLAALGGLTAVLVCAHSAFIDARIDEKGRRAVDFCRRVEARVPVGEPIWVWGNVQGRYRANIAREFRTWERSDRPMLVLVTSTTAAGLETLSRAEVLERAEIDRGDRPMLVRVTP